MQSLFQSAQLCYVKIQLATCSVLSAYIQASSTVYINKYPNIRCHTNLKS